MKKTVFGAVLVVLALSLPCYGEEKFFLTDVLSEKEMETAITFSYQRFSNDASGESPVFINTYQEIDAWNAKYFLNLGLGHGLEVGAALPYLMNYKARSEFYNSDTEVIREERSGFGDFQLGGKWRVFGEEEKPFTLVAGLGVKFETALEKDGGTGNTHISPFLAASTTLRKGIRPWAAYEYTNRNHGARDSHTIEVGVEKELDERVGVDASGGISLHTSSDLVDGYETYFFGIASYVGLYGNFYIIPAVVFRINSSTDLRDVDVGNSSTDPMDVDVRFDTSREISARLSFYYLF